MKNLLSRCFKPFLFFFFFDTILFINDNSVHNIPNGRKSRRGSLAQRLVTHTNIEMLSIVGSMKAAIKRSIPTAAFFILITEFCERFSYYGMRSVLTLFLKDFLKFNEHQTVEFFHIFVVITYSASVLGAYISDRHLGRYDTILKCGFFFLIGSATLTIGSVPYIGSDSMNYRKYRKKNVFD